MADYFNGPLSRLHTGAFKTWRTYHYIKQGIFLREEPKKGGTISNIKPREIIDLTGAVIEDSSSESTKPESFSIATRNGRQYHFIAPSIEDKTKWLSVLNERRVDSAARDRRGSASSLIAPVRRRQTRSDAVQGMMIRRIAIIEADRRGIITQFNTGAERMFGYTEVDVVGKNVSILMPESFRSKHDEHVESFGERDRPPLVGQYRKLQGLRKNGELFPVQIVLELTAEGNFLTRMIELDVQGREKEETDEEYTVLYNLRVKILEGKHLGSAKKKELQVKEPYCVILVDQVQRALTSTKSNTCDPFWGEEFLFDEIKPSTGSLTIVVNNLSKTSKDPRVGHIHIDLLNKAETSGIEKWHNLLPLRSTNKGDDLGALRIRVTLLEEKILPLREYSDLLEIVLDEELVVASTLAMVAGNQLEEIAGTLVNIFTMKGRVTDFIKFLTMREINETEYGNVIFRGNSLATKVIDLYMKMIGSTYLHETLVPLLSEVYEDNLSCELDPTRLAPGESIPENLKRLTFYVIRFWEAISSSVVNCPQEFLFVFEGIRESVAKKWPEGPERFTAVSGFIFLRFFCPAILDPYLFSLMDEHPSGNAQRTLMLIAKCLQNLANLVECGEKEPYMKVMNVFIVENLEKMQKCISSFSKPKTLDQPKPDQVDQQALRRELAALYRHLMDRRDAISAKRENMKEESFNQKLDDLYDILDRLERRYMVHERSKAFTQRLSIVEGRPSAIGMPWEAGRASIS